MAEQRFRKTQIGVRFLGLAPTMSGCSGVRYHTWPGTRRPRVRILPPGPSKPGSATEARAGPSGEDAGSTPVQASTYWTDLHDPLYATVSLAAGVLLIALGGFLLASGGWHVAKAGA